MAMLRFNPTDTTGRRPVGDRRRPLELVRPLLRPTRGTVEVDVLGLIFACWCCGTTGTALVGLARPGADIEHGDFVSCRSELSLAVANRYLSDEVRTARRLHGIRYGFTAPGGETELSNACRNCGVAFGVEVVSDEAVPRALELSGAGAFEHLGVVEIDGGTWSQLNGCAQAPRRLRATA